MHLKTISDIPVVLKYGKYDYPVVLMNILITYLDRPVYCNVVSASVFLDSLGRH